MGLGTGSTALYAIRRIAALIREVRLPGVLCIPTSKGTELEARGLGIPLTSLDEHPVIDLTIDGADEVDQALNLIKGAGGALFREKVVAEASLRTVIVVDESKLSPLLGTRKAVPVEVTGFARRPVEEHLKSLGAKVAWRMDAAGEPFVTDEGNFILDCSFGPIEDPAGLAQRLGARAGVVGHGLFIGLASEVIVAGRDGVRSLRVEKPLGMT